VPLLELGHGWVVDIQPKEKRKKERRKKNENEN
jgi:hypothetical protein